MGPGGILRRIRSVAPHRWLCLATCLCASAVAAPAALADDIYVPAPSKKDSGSVALRQAFARAAETPGPDTIFLRRAVYVLGGGCQAGSLRVPAGRGDLLVIGNGATLMRTCPTQPTLDVDGVLELRDLKVTATAPGTAALVEARGVVRTRQVEITEGGGSGLACQGCSELALTDSRVTSNSGGGVNVASGGESTSVVLRDTQVSQNSSGADGAGIVMSSNAPGSRLTLVDSGVTGNVATGKGGGVSVSGTDVVMLRSRIQSNAAGTEETPGSGGGLAVRAGDDPVRVQVTASTISGNRAAFAGGGISSQGRVTLMVVGSVVQDNTAAAQGGGIATNTERGTLVVNGSTIARNTAGPASGGGGVSAVGAGRVGVVVRSTLVSNSAGRGGAVDVGDQAWVTVQRSTLVRNSSSRGANLAVSGSAVVTTLANVVALPYEGASCDVSGEGTLASNGFSLVSDTSCAPGYGDVVDSSDPGVSELWSPPGSSGAPPVARLAAQSPAVGIVPAEFCAGMRDQLGNPRGDGGPCSAGAMEPSKPD